MYSFFPPLIRIFIEMKPQLSDNDSQDLPPFPDPREDKPSGSSGAAAGGETGPILPVPVGIRPTLATYR